MAIIEKIKINNFKNIEWQDLSFSSKINCISGNNGEGKTNLLDAIYYLSMTKSAFSSLEKYNYRYGSEEFSLYAKYLLNNNLHTELLYKVSNKSKRISRDEKLLERLSDHIGNFPIVMVSPSDIALVGNSDEERRRFVNFVLSQINKEYLDKIMRYNYILSNRNKLLKLESIDKDLIDFQDIELSQLAQYIYGLRKQFIEDLSPILAKYYKILSSDKEQVSIQYSSDLDRGDLYTILKNNFNKDLILKRTNYGIHKDEILFQMGEYSIRRSGSQGQQKSFLLALKFAQYELMKKVQNVAPILLLDDLFDKLDMTRVENLLSMVISSDFGQIFISDSNKIRMQNIVDKLTMDSAYYEAVNGCFTKLD